MSNHKLEVVIPPTTKDDTHVSAVVLVFGWFGAQMRHVNKYSEIYQKRNCATVTGCASSFDVMTANKPGLDAFALAAAKEVISILKNDDDHQDLPVLVHVFSNGGTMPLNRLESMIYKANRARALGKARELDHDLILLGNAMGGTIFDSSPAYPDETTVSRAIEGAVSNPFIRSFLQGFVALFMFVESQKEQLCWNNYQSASNQLWNHVMYRGVTPQAAYIYSTADHITNHKKLEELIAHQTGQLGAMNVLVQKFTDSDHVMHLRKHPQEYVALIDQMLKRVMV